MTARIEISIEVGDNRPQDIEQKVAEVFSALHWKLTNGGSADNVTKRWNERKDRFEELSMDDSGSQWSAGIVVEP